MARTRRTRASEDAAHRVALAWMRIRVAVVGGLLGAGLLVLLGRAVDLQVVQHDRLAQMARDQTLRKVEVQAPRARIEDRNGEALALSVDVDSVAVDPSRLKDRAATARALAGVLEADAGALEARLARGRYFAWVRRSVSPAQAEAVRRLGLPGVFLVREARRFYPHRELAAQVLGFVGVDGDGLEGLELSLDPVLRGQRTSALALRDAHGRRLLQDDPFGASEAGPGKVRLTLDRTIQWITERALMRAVRTSEARAGMAVVLEPSTGAVLALASVPTYNPNRPGDAERRARRDRPLTDVYEPGSTFKVFTLGAALEAGQVTPETTIECEGGAWKVAGRVIHDSHPHRRLTVTEVLTKSSNIGAAKIAASLGRDRLVDTLEAAGFGQRTGLRLPGEQSGILHRRDRIGPVELATLAFGQGIAVTPMQLASAISAVANGGVRMKPYLVARVEHPDGSVEVTRPRVAGRIFSARTAAMLTRMMETVTRPGGTGPRAAVPGFTVAGKTGTSQKPDPLTRSYSPDKRVASFVGFVPSRAPRLTILVVVDEPQGVKYGGVVAAPAFREIAEASLRYLGVPPTEPLPALAERSPEEANAGASDDERQETITALLPFGLVPPPEGKTLVPDTVGMDLRSALRILAERQLEPRPTGTGLVRSQSPRPGTIAGPGTPVEIHLAPRG